MLITVLLMGTFAPLANQDFTSLMDLRYLQTQV
jgi:hypothetical protein